MATDPTPAQLDAIPALPDAPPGLVTGYGPGGDVDAAFDAAAALAADTHGSTGAHPSLAGCDPSAIRPVDTTPAPAPAVALAVAAAAADLEPGVVHAWPVCAPAAYTRRRVRITLTDPALPAVTPGRVTRLDDTWASAIRAALDADGAPLVDGEIVESVDVVRHRARYKPVVTVNRGKSASRFAVLDPATSTLVATGFRTAGDARRAAVALAKAGPVTTAGPDPDVAALHVVKVTGREDDLPLIRVDRTRVKATTVLKVTIAAPKQTARGLRTTGWVFAHTPAAADDLDDATQEPHPTA